MKTLFRALTVGLALGAAGVATTHADEALRRVQQSLRDQGFYYGPIDGSPGDETTQAIRRYQIRNGLPVNGQLDDETRRTIDKTGGEVAPITGGSKTGRPLVRLAPSATPRAATGQAPRSVPDEAPAPGYQRPTVRPVPEANRPVDPRADDDDSNNPPPRGRDPRDDRRAGPIERDDRPGLRVSPGGAPGGPMPRNAVLPSARLSALFASTPYEFAPPPVQADVLRRVQGALTRQGFYDGPINGIPSPLVDEALADYQGVNRLRKTGRLDVATLGNLRLLPGRQTLVPRGRGDDADDDEPRSGPGVIFEGRVVR